MSWTDERIATLTKMWEGGSTASQIAEELGGVSRNAVIGKAHRLGLKARPSPVKANDQPKKAKPATAPAKRPAPPAAADAPKAKLPPRQLAPKPVVEEEREDKGIAGKTNTAVPSQPLPNAGSDRPKIVSVGPGGFLRQGPGPHCLPQADP